MAFKLSAIQQAHQQFTGVDFPKLFKAFKDMGMTYNIVQYSRWHSNIRTSIRR
ncbi:phage envelope protein [Staphylococcus aureus]|uniref:Phage envelope protein n=1 Tax=Staphylococcus aureus TaxID=1280 RepID=A0A2X2JYG3_STAAU|nr:phage envelope protein [Staphylococcus aureus]